MNYIRNPGHECKWDINIHSRKTVSAQTHKWCKEAEVLCTYKFHRSLGFFLLEVHDSTSTSQKSCVYMWCKNFFSKIVKKNSLAKIKLVHLRPFLFSLPFLKVWKQKNLPASRAHSHCALRSQVWARLGRAIRSSRFALRNFWTSRFALRSFWTSRFALGLVLFAYV